MTTREALANMLVSMGNDRVWAECFVAERFGHLSDMQMRLVALEFAEAVRRIPGRDDLLAPLEQVLRDASNATVQ